MKKFGLALRAMFRPLEIETTPLAGGWRTFRSYRWYPIVGWRFVGKRTQNSGNRCRSVMR